MRRFLKCGLPVGLFLLVTLFYPLLAPPAHRIDEAHFEQIREGMTLGEVESRFGVPAGNYDWAVAKDPSIYFWDVATGAKLNEIVFASDVVTLRPTKDAVVWNLPYVEESRLYTTNVTLIVGYHINNPRAWTSRHGSCTIYFDQHNKVVAKSGWGETRLEPPWHNWRKWFSK